MSIYDVAQTCKAPTNPIAYGRYGRKRWNMVEKMLGKNPDCPEEPSKWEERLLAARREGLRRRGLLANAVGINPSSAGCSGGQRSLGGKGNPVDKRPIPVFPVRHNGLTQLEVFERNLDALPDTTITRVYSERGELVRVVRRTPGRPGEIAEFDKQLSFPPVLGDEHG